MGRQGSGHPLRCVTGTALPTPPADRAGEVETPKSREKKEAAQDTCPPPRPHGYFEMKRMWFCKAQNLMMNVPPSSLQSSGPGYF